MNQDNRDFFQEEIASLNEDVPPMPEDFHQGWMKKVEEDMENKKKTPIRTTVIRVLAAAAALVFVVGGALMAQPALQTPGQTAANSSVQLSRSYAMDEGAVSGQSNATGSYSMKSTSMTARGAEPEEDSAAAEKKIIRTASLTILTQVWDESLEMLKSLCTDMGGWIESASENTSSGLRTAYLTLRVPSDQLDAFLASSGGAGRVTRRDESAVDVTESYQDTAARLATQEALMARLLALVTDAASLSDLLALEAQIADTQYQIDRLQSSLNATDRQVDYSSVSITLKEEKPSADTDEDIPLLRRLGLALEAGWEAFMAFVEGAAVFAAAALPFAGIAGLAWFVVRWIRKAIQRRK